MHCMSYHLLNIGFRTIANVLDMRAVLFSLQCRCSNTDIIAFLLEFTAAGAEHRGCMWVIKQTQTQPDMLLPW